MQAIIYVRADPGKPLKLLKKIRDMEGVKFAAATTGRFDLVLRVEAEDIEAMGDKVVGEIHELEGVRYTETSPIVA